MMCLARLLRYLGIKRKRSGMIRLKTAEQIKRIKESCRILVETFQYVQQFVQPGIKTIEIDREVENFIQAKHGIPAFKGFNGFPGSACISIDDQVVHGIPGQRKLENGQIVGVDIGINFNGYFSDSAFTFPVGKIDAAARRLLTITRESLYKGIEQAKVGNRLSGISHAIQVHAESNGYSVVRELVGHGVGLDVWEPPQIPNYGAPGKGIKLQSGMVVALEPMINIGDYDVETGEDDWTVVTVDGSLSAHFEHTIAITDNGTEILTEGVGK